MITGFFGVSAHQKGVTMRYARVVELAKNGVIRFQEDGPRALADRAVIRLRNMVYRRRQSDDHLDRYVDVLFINGCAYSVPHPIRYRVDHQIEQLNAYGVSARKIDEWDLAIDDVRTARSFIIFRCPYNERIGNFIKRARSLHKRVYFDIDDLVIDRKYTDLIKFLDTMSPEERAGYNEGVDAMRKTMLQCDGVITSTRGMADELVNYLPLVYINRNVASEQMVFLSERALEERDIFPSKTEDEISKKDVRRWKKAVQEAALRNDKKVHIGYFSGSITHNEDFELILPALKKIMEQYSEVILHVVGELDLPHELETFRDRVVAEPFLSWKRLPRLISSMDINLAPLVDSVFNRAKSENKWLEAALVKVPTVASNVGAFSEVVVHGRTGMLCSSVEDWFTEISRLIESPKLRKTIGSLAYEQCRNHKTTITAGCGLADFLTSHQTENIAFVMPSLDISGGNLVTLKHAEIMHRHGYDVSILDGFGNKRWIDTCGVSLPVLNRRVHPHLIDSCPVDGVFDNLVSTFWQTEQFVDRYRRVGKRFYLVQNLEYDFYEPPAVHRIEASATYRDRTQCVTISKWCKEWLSDQYHQIARYAPNGLDTAAFFPVDRDYSGKIRVLIEGDCGVDYKNVDESFAITDLLDRERFEIWYLSYNANPKPFYRYDRFLHAVPYNQVPAIYQQCHVLLKTSLVESFSYPPLEMMATGGAAVVLSNPGNAEYLVHGENALLFERGEDEKAANLIRSIADDPKLRADLRAGGIRTAASRDWAAIDDEIVNLYR